MYVAPAVPYTLEYKQTPTVLISKKSIAHATAPFLQLIRGTKNCENFPIINRARFIIRENCADSWFLESMVKMAQWNFLYQVPYIQ